MKRTLPAALREFYMEKDETWDKLEEYLDRELYFASGSGLLIACTCIDTGGHYTTECYKWLKKMEAKNKKIYGIKGMGGPGIPLIHKVSKNNEYKVKIFILGVDSGKEILMTRLKIEEEGPGYCHFPSNSELRFITTAPAGYFYLEAIVLNVNAGRQKKNAVGDLRFVFFAAAYQ